MTLVSPLSDTATVGRKRCRELKIAKCTKEFFLQVPAPPGLSHDTRQVLLWA
jgi:hypothetical protein